MQGQRMRSLGLVAVVALSVIGGCTATPPTNVAARKLTPVAPGEIRRVAVMPFTAAALETPPPPLPNEPRVVAPADIVTLAVVQTLQQYDDWEIVDAAVTQDAFQRLYGEVRAPTPEEAIAVGKHLGVHAALRGQVSEFFERVGTEFGVKEPARVAFAAELVRLPSGERVWQAEYAERQQALTENLWNVSGWFQAGAKWVSAAELAELGAARVAAQLHEALTGSKKPPPRARKN